MSYDSFIALSNQFKFCGNAFRIDTYRGCDFGCQYCYANAQVTGKHNGLNNVYDVVNNDNVDKVFFEALETDKRPTNLTYELLRNRVPLHCGGMADPFQRREFSLGATKHLLELSNKYNYPICFSTKTAHLPDEYLELLNINIHAFQVSILGYTAEWCNKFEHNTPSPEKRVAFVKSLRDLGFWCSVRIQPLIDLDEALLLVNKVSSIPSYITIEHLKIPQTNMKFCNAYYKYIPNLELYVHTTTYYELPRYVKERNIKALQAVANKNGVLVGVGDNDLHYLSQSRCCCGIDTIKEFDGYLKYNSTYMTTGAMDKNVYIPKSNCSGCLFSDSLKKFDTPFVSYKEIVDRFLIDHHDIVYPPKRGLF